jgi:hypothetical protein
MIMSSGRPESEMFRIQVDAKNKELVLPAEDGILTFLVDQHQDKHSLDMTFADAGMP